MDERSDFTAFINMLSNAGHVSDFTVYDEYGGGKAVEFICRDEWYDMVFHFDHYGKLVSVE